MRNFFFATAAMMLSSAALAAPPSDTDRAALQQLAADLDRIWDGGDPAAVTALYAKDGSVRMDGRTIAQGQEAVRRYFEETIARRPANLRHVTVIEKLDLLTPDLALADSFVRIEQEQPGGGRRVLGEFRTPTIAIREDGKWRFRAVRAHRLPPTKPAA